MKKSFCFISILAVVSIIVLSAFGIGYSVRAHGHDINDFAGNPSILMPVDMPSNSVPERIYSENYVPHEKALKINFFTSGNLRIEQIVEGYLSHTASLTDFKQGRIKMRRWNI